MGGATRHVCIGWSELMDPSMQLPALVGTRDLPCRRQESPLLALLDLSQTSPTDTRSNCSNLPAELNRWGTIVAKAYNQAHVCPRTVPRDGDPR